MQHADSEQAAVPPFDVKLLSAFPALQSAGTATVDSIRYSELRACIISPFVRITIHSRSL